MFVQRAQDCREYICIGKGNVRRLLNITDKVVQLFYMRRRKILSSLCVKVIQRYHLKRSEKIVK
jgi:hypothetical protein